VSYIIPLKLGCKKEEDKHDGNLSALLDKPTSFDLLRCRIVNKNANHILVHNSK
jgi:hypothetical protein